MRIDKLLCELNIGSRSEVKTLIKKGQIIVNGVKIGKPETKVDETTAEVSYGGKIYRYQPFVYFLLNKPAGVVSATEDPKERTVLDVLKEELQKEYGAELSGINLKEVFPVGRLDKDTVGLLLLTNDGELTHDLLSPKKHVKKCYYVETDQVISKEAIERLIAGVDIGEKNLTKEAELIQIEEKSCKLWITEGKFHQVKRMFQAVGLKVLYLKRISMGNLTLPKDLMEGQVLMLSKEEVINGRKL